jgi:hypothetical protein
MEVERNWDRGTGDYDVCGEREVILGCLIRVRACVESCDGWIGVRRGDNILTIRWMCDYVIGRQGNWFSEGGGGEFGRGGDDGRVIEGDEAYVFG